MWRRISRRSPRPSASTFCPRNHTSPAVGSTSRSRAASRGCLAAAGFAHQPERLTRLDRKADVVHGADDGRLTEKPASSREVLRQMPDVNEGHRLDRLARGLCRGPCALSHAPWGLRRVPCGWGREPCAVCREPCAGRIRALPCVAGRPVCLGKNRAVWNLVGAHRKTLSASRLESAARREQSQRRHRPLNCAQSSSGASSRHGREQPRGCRDAKGALKSARTRILLRQCGRPSDGDAVRGFGDDAEVVRNEQEGQNRYRSPELTQQIEDLGLDRHVQRGRRLVGDENRWFTRPERWRSSPAGASPPRADAGSRARGAAASGIPHGIGATPRALVRASRAHPLRRCATSTSANLVADREDRVEGG